jgi:hypothetical protein
VSRFAGEFYRRKTEEHGWDAPAAVAKKSRKKVGK